MKYSIIFLLVTLNLFICLTATADDIASDPSEFPHILVEHHAQTIQQALLPDITQISFSTSNSIAPYFFANKPQGVQYDLLVTALKLSGISMTELVHAPNLRAQRLVDTKRIDCMINTPNHVDGMFYTQSLIEYQNSVFYLSKNKLNINKIEDLKSISILGFQNATKYLGEEFSEVTKQNPLYSEISNQKSQVVMLFNGHIQSVVLERRIFEYYRHQLRHKLDTSLAVTEVALFAPAERKIACHNKDTAAVLDNAITTLKQSYQYQEILSLAEQNSYQPAQHANRLTK
ncbi:transporter substrate-binding domain-containing protein [Shewanella saliphila]|uniref:Solute-binding protein family 3/N-terminal domain-containing protein n=1 Tax=Shewanella saliphila TaxID=2282698 RepID=A0ABQ2Q537_9GAMM|nr:transporter substrate-binding domain-containing protein [Shewanella saliphila]MCL1101117.1 transporter substrate-binding domain-containing protein [Shewanella saliphila]GGP45973.1 hypothetical protein GCM10009409_10810 [Shewanella saliphila]